MILRTVSDLLPQTIMDICNIICIVCIHVVCVPSEDNFFFLCSFAATEKVYHTVFMRTIVHKKTYQDTTPSFAGYLASNKRAVSAKVKARESHKLLNEFLHRLFDRKTNQHLSNLTTMKLFEQAIAKNNEGARFLSLGESKKAFACFQGSLALVGEATSDSAASIDDGQHEDRICDVLASSSAVLDVKAGEASLSSAFFVFKRAFVVKRCQMSEGFASALVVICLFNIALLYHHKGDERALQKAQRFYDLSLDILRKVNCGPLASIISLAAQNNRIDALYKLERVDEGERAIHQVNHLLRDLRHLDQFFDSEDIEDFTLNVLLGAMTATRTAAAA